MEFILNTVDRKAYGVGGAKVRRLVVFSGKGVYRISLNFFFVQNDGGRFIEGEDYFKYCSWDVIEDSRNNGK